MEVDDLHVAYIKLEESPEPHWLVDFGENLISQLFDGKINSRTAFCYQEKLESIGAANPMIGCNCVRYAHKMWDVIEWATDVIGGSTGYPLTELQNDLTELYLEGFRLRHEGWEAVLPYVRTYYHKKTGGKVISSKVFTAYERGGVLRCFTADKEIGKVLTQILDASVSLDAFSVSIPKKISNFEIRDIVTGYSLQSDFAD